MRVLLIGTFETKGAELAYLSDAMTRNGLEVEQVDISLGSGGAILSGAEKLARMANRAETAASQIAAHCDDCYVAVGVGGGTGAEIVLAALKGLPAVYPKMLITTMAFDPRVALADTAITLVPTLCDIEGLNPALRQVFENAASMVAGLYRAQIAPKPVGPPIGVTTLGSIGKAGTETQRLLAAAGYEVTVFHANGYGGAAFARFIQEGHVHGIIDLCVHELGRKRIAGAHAPMPGRFTVAGALPRVVLPGALNFIGLGEIDTISAAHRARPHYRHSAFFTHVKLTAEEMVGQAEALAERLNQGTRSADVLVPMGGFSHEDRPGGAIEDPTLREIAADILERNARAFRVRRLDHHINDPEVAHEAVAALQAIMSKRTEDA